MPLVERDPAILSGAPRIRGTRVYAEQVAKMLRDGHTYAECRAEYSSLPELSSAEIAMLHLYPSADHTWGAGEHCTVGLDWRDGGLFIADEMVSVDVEWRDVGPLVAALAKAREGYKQWMRDVVEWQRQADAACPAARGNEETL